MASPFKIVRAAAKQVVSSIATLFVDAQVKRPPSPFEEWDYEEATEALADAFDAQTIDTSRNTDDSGVGGSVGSVTFLPRQDMVNPILTNRAFYQGDHWQNGAGWIGPHPEMGNPSFNESMLEIAKIFTSKNAVKEVVSRHMLGVLGKNIQWGFAPTRDLANDEKPTDEEQRLIDEATALIRDWLKKRKVVALLRDAVTTLLLSERAALRLGVPAGLSEERGGQRVVVATSVAQGLQYIFPEHPLPEDAAVITDNDTKLDVGVWAYTAERETGATVEGDTPTSTVGTEEEDYAAVCFVTQDGLTVTRIFKEKADTPDSEQALNLGGRLQLYEMRRNALITLQVQQQQRALNLAESMIPRAGVTSGFLERLLIDAQLPGKREVVDGKETGRWIEEPFYTGAGTVNFLQSSEFMDEEGKIKRANAQAIFRDPIPPEGPIAASTKHYHAILDETGQLHAIMSGNATPSGVSRLNARIEYLTTLQMTQEEAEGAFRFLVDTALAMAEALAQKPGQYTKTIRCQASCRLDTGTLAPDERTAIEASIGKTLSRETAMALVGVEDIDAEMARIAADPLSRAALATAVGTALLALTTPGASLEGAATFMGIEPEDMKKLLTAPDPPPPPVTVPPVPPPPKAAP
jgi:hypothetical protein